MWANLIVLPFKLVCKQEYFNFFYQGNSSKEPDTQQLKQYFSHVEVFRFKPNISECMQAADLIISHGGSGSIFESLNLNKPLLVVVNETLADNHQFEIADKLQAEGYYILQFNSQKDRHLLRTTVTELPQLLSKSATFAALSFVFHIFFYSQISSSLKPLPKANASAFAALVQDELL